MANACKSRPAGVALLSVLWLAAASAQVTVMVDATTDPHGAAPGSAVYSHLDAINPYRGQVSLREALYYANPEPLLSIPGNRAKIGRRGPQTVLSQALLPSDKAWAGYQGIAASPLTGGTTALAGGTGGWVGTGGAFSYADGNWSVGTVQYTTPGSDGKPLGPVQVPMSGLLVTNFGFNIPSGSQITGVRVEVARHLEGGFGAGNLSASDRTLQLVKAGALAGANNGGSPWSRGQLIPGSDEFVNPLDPANPTNPQLPQPTDLAGGFGNSADLWATNWTATDINDPQFGVVIAPTITINGLINDGNTTTVRCFIDFVRVTVYINPTPDLSLVLRSDDSQRAICRLAANQATARLTATNFGFNSPTQYMPDNAQIVGIAARVVRSTAPFDEVGKPLARSMVDSEVRLTTARGVSPLNRATNTGLWPQDNQDGFEPTADITGVPADGGVYGGDTDLWGFSPTSLTGADINNPAFGVIFSGRDTGANNGTPGFGNGAIAHVNFVELSVFYKVDAGVVMTITVARPMNLTPATPLPDITRSNLSISGDINGDGLADLRISTANFLANQAAAGVLKRTAIDGSVDAATEWHNYGLRVGNRRGSGSSEQAPSNVVIDGVAITGAVTTGNDTLVPNLWFYAGDNLKLVNSDMSNSGIGILSSIQSPQRLYIGSNAAGSDVNVGHNLHAGIYCIGSGQTQVQRTTLASNGTAPGGRDPYSAQIVLAGSGDNVIGSPQPGATNTITGTNVTTAFSGVGYGITVPGTGNNTIQYNTIAGHATAGLWLASTDRFPGRANPLLPARSRPYPTTILGNTITGNGTAAGAWSHAGIWVTSNAGDDTEAPNSSAYATDYNLIQSNRIADNGGAGVYLDGPGKTRIGGTDPRTANAIIRNGALLGANGVEQSGIEIRSAGSHYGDARHPVTAANPQEVYANIIENNLIGLFDGAAPNRGHGIDIGGADDNLIGGFQTASRNVISANTLNAIRINGTGANRICGNYLGLAASGLTDLGNGVNGVEITAGASGNNIIGGASLAERNVIAGNTNNGIVILGGGSNKVYGNYIGLAADGTTALVNGFNGVSITQQATGINYIGGSQPGQRNFISGNTQYGVSIQGNASGQTNVVIGNYIGLADSPTNTVPNAARNGLGGVLVNCAVAQQIGGSQLGEGNCISGNGGNAVELSGAGVSQGAGKPQGHQVLGNVLGGKPIRPRDWPTDGRLSPEPSGANTGSGVFINPAATGNIQIGGVGLYEGNTIALNQQWGINAAGSGVATIYNNRIGTGLDANNAFQAMPNGRDGVLLSGTANNLVGGDDDTLTDKTLKMHNVIAANGGNGVSITGQGNNQIVGNRLGTSDAGDVAVDPVTNPGTTALPAAASRNGVAVTGTGANVIRKNVISGHANAGVFFSGAGSLRISANFIGTDQLFTTDATTLVVSRRATKALPNGTAGVYVPANSTGTLYLSDGASNVISGNLGDGVHLEGDYLNDVRGNLIGTDSDGVNPVGNGGDGIYLAAFVLTHGTLGATTDVTGGVTRWGNAITNNNIAANRGNGIQLRGGSTVIWNNCIGATRHAVDPTRAWPLGNALNGILVDDQNLLVNRQNVVIGVYPEQSLASADLARNQIVANGGDGIRLVHAGGDNTSSLNDDVLIRGNYIGAILNYGPAGNRGSGIAVQRTVNGRVQIGAVSNTPDNVRNVIDSNSGWGIDYQAQYTLGSKHEPLNAPLIMNNYIGVADDGVTASGNGAGGVRVDVNDSFHEVRIGDDGSGTGRGAANFSNLIGGSGGPGVAITSPAQVSVYGNYIGLGANGQSVLGMGQEGVLVNCGPTGRVRVGDADDAHRLRNVIVGCGGASTAGAPYFAVRAASGWVTTVDNVVGGNEDGARNAVAMPTGACPGGGIFYDAGVTAGGNVNGVYVPSMVKGNYVLGNGGGAGFAGVRVDAGVPVLVSANQVLGGTGAGVQLGGADATTVDSNVVQNNLGAGVLVGGTGAHRVSNNQVVANGNTQPAAPGVLLTGSGAYHVYGNTITLSGSDGITINIPGATPTAGGPVRPTTPVTPTPNPTPSAVLMGPSVGYQSAADWRDDTTSGGNGTTAGAGTGSGANLITQNNGWGINLVTGTGNRLSGNLISANNLGGISTSFTYAPQLNGLLAVPQGDGSVKWRVSGTVYQSTLPVTGTAFTLKPYRIEIYEAADPAMLVPSSDGHRGQVGKRLCTLTSNTDGTFTTSGATDLADAAFQQGNPDLKLITALAIDENPANPSEQRSGDTSMYARNTGRPNVASVNGNLVQSSISVTSKQIIADRTPTPSVAPVAPAVWPAGGSDVVLTVRDVIGTPLPGVTAKVSLGDPDPAKVDTSWLVSVPVLDNNYVTDANGQIVHHLTATDRPTCSDITLRFKATSAQGVLGLGAVQVALDNAPTVTVVGGKVKGDATTLTLDAQTIASQRVASGADPALVIVTVRDDSLTHCPLGSVSKDLLHVVQVKANATDPTAVIGVPVADTDASGQAQVPVTATVAGTYVFSVWVDANGNGKLDDGEAPWIDVLHKGTTAALARADAGKALWIDSNNDNVPQPGELSWTDADKSGTANGAEAVPTTGNVAVTFKPGSVGTTASHVTADKGVTLGLVAIADGGKLASGVADPLGKVTLTMTLKDSTGNPLALNMPPYTVDNNKQLDKVEVRAVDVATGRNLGLADGFGFSAPVKPDLVANPLADPTALLTTVTLTKPAVVRLSVVVTVAGVPSTVVDQPVVDFRAPVSPSLSTVTVTPTTLKADGQSAAQVTVTLVDGTDQHKPVVGLVPNSALAIVPDNSDVDVLWARDPSGAILPTDATGTAIATITGRQTMAVPTDVTLLVQVTWPDLAKPDVASQARMPVLTLDTQPVEHFGAGTGTTVTVTSSTNTWLAPLRPNGRDKVTLTATVRDKGAHPVPNARVVLSANRANGLTITQPILLTDANGQVTATVTSTEAFARPWLPATKAEPDASLPQNEIYAALAALLVPLQGDPQKFHANLWFEYPDPDPGLSRIFQGSADSPLLADGKAKLTGVIELRDASSATGDPIPGVDPAKLHVDVVGGLVPAGVTIGQPAVSSNASGQTSFTVTSTRAASFILKVSIQRTGGGWAPLAGEINAKFLDYVTETFTPGLNMMCTALTPPDPAPATVLTSLPSFRLARWLGDLQNYLIWQPVGSPPLPFQMLPGRAFWLQTDSGATLNLAGDSVATVVTRPGGKYLQSPVIPVNAGWNMVGNPFAAGFKFKLSNIHVLQNGVEAGTLDTAAGQALAAPYVWVWDPALQYKLVLDSTVVTNADPNPIPLGRGFWWLAKQSGVSLQLETAVTVTTGRAAAPAPAPTLANWSVGLKATAAAGSGEVVLGHASSGLRAALPPAAPTGSALKVELVDAQGRAATDLRSGGLTGRERWTVNVTASAPGEVTLTWPTLARGLPAGASLWLTDGTNGQRVRLNDRASYSYTADTAARALTLDFDAHGTRSLAIGGLSVTKPGSGRSATGIGVTLTGDASLTVTIRGLSGRVVRVLQATGNTGVNTVAWDGRDSDGRPLPAGTYAVDVTAVGADGEVARQSVTASLR